MDKLQSYNLTLSKVITEICKEGGIAPFSHILTSKNRFFPPLFDLLVSGDFSYQPQRLITMILFIRFFVITKLRILSSVIKRRKKLKLYLSQIKHSGKKVYLFKSFRMGNKVFSKTKDPFFGPLVEMLAGEKIEPVFFIENLGGGILDTKKNEEQFLEVVDFVNYMDLIWVFKESIRSFLKGGNIDEIDDPLFLNKKKEFQNILKWEYLKPSTLNSLVYYRATKNLLEKIKIDKYIYPYENNCWERMALLAMKGLTGIETVGYQHNVVPLSSLNMFPLENEISVIPQPQKVLTTGAYTRNLLGKLSGFPIERIQESCALRYIYLHNSKKLERNKSKIVLVAFEGVGQIREIIERIYELKSEEQGIRYLFRFHPVLPFEQVTKKLSFDLEKVENFEVSRGKSVYDDLERAGLVLYWGSTLGLESIKMGRPVINVNFTGTSFDPLFELSSFKRSWNIQENTLEQRINELFNLTDETFGKEFQLAASFIDSYFYPVTRNNLQPFIGEL